MAFTCDYIDDLFNSSWVGNLEGVQDPWYCSFSCSAQDGVTCWRTCSRGNMNSIELDSNAESFEDDFKKNDEIGTNNLLIMFNL